MKTNNIYKGLVIATLLFFSFTMGAVAQSLDKKQKEEQKEAIIKEAVDSKNFIFKAQTMIPSNGMSRQLTADYDLNISDNKIISFLPYMGRVFTPMFNPSEGPLTFTSKDFSYTSQSGKKGGWNISIKPKDVRSVREYTLTVMEDGYATLLVTGNDRQPVTFYGYIIDKNA